MSDHEWVLRRLTVEGAVEDDEEEIENGSVGPEYKISGP